MSFNERTIMVLGEEKYQKIAHRHVLLVGVGGVGGAVLECLVRFGIEEISIIDFDTVDLSNLNRQLISTLDCVDKTKVEVARQRALSINPNCKVNAFDTFIQKENLDLIKQLNPDFVVDAIDSVKSKLDLIQFCHENEIDIVSSMGTGNRFDLDGFVIDTVEKTAGNGCGLSRVVRQELKKRGVYNHYSLFNVNPPQSKAVNSSNGRHAPGSTPFAPNLAGIMLAQYVCKKLAEK